MSHHNNNGVQAGKKNIDFVKILLEGRAFFALLAIIIVFSILSPVYFSTGNFLTMSSHVAVFGLLGVGMLFVILTGGIDLSVGSTLALSGVFAGMLLEGVEIEALDLAFFPSVWVVVVLTCLLGGVVGAINGVLVAYFKVPAFVATLGMLYVARGAALLLTDGLTFNSLSGDPALGNTGFEWLGFNKLLGIPVGILILFSVAAICMLALSRTPFGRWVYSTGGNARAAELSGVPVNKVKLSVYIISGVCAAIAGIVLASQLTSAGPTAGTTYELTAIAAVVIGGASLMGGRGTIRNTLLGAFVIGFLADGLVIIGVSAYWQMVFTGSVIVFAVMLNNVQYSANKKPSKKADKEKIETNNEGSSASAA